MITKLGFKNFKTWQEFGPVDFAPLTVLFGANSSGKSSVAQMLLMLKQTAESSDRKLVFNTGGQKTAVDLGNFYEMVFEHEESSRIDVDLTWNLPQELTLVDSYAQRDYSADRIRFETSVGLFGKTSAPAVERMKYTFGDITKAGFSAGMTRTEKTAEPYDLTQQKYKFVRNRGRIWPITEPAKCYGFPDEVVNYYRNADVVKALGLSFEKLFQQVYYLGPLRERFLRQYTWTGEAPEHVGWRGEATVTAILAGKDRTFNKGKGSTKKPLAETVAFWLKQMGLIDSFEVKPLAPKRREYEVLVRSPGSRKPVNITDVGFGVSQFLPVLVQALYAPPNSIIVIEQPEIHLHPAAQAWLADLFIEIIRGWGNGKKRNVQLIIESHSEHFLRRLQRRIAEKAFSREEVAAYFFHPEIGGSKLESLDVDIFGNIRNWPDKFFGDTMEDAIAMTDAQMERMSKGERPQ
jgi:predicted ATPase